MKNLPPAPSPVPHFHSLDGLRALPALAVLWCHSQLPNWRDWPLGFELTKKLHVLSLYDNMGHFAVNLFIVLSGFCLMLPVVRGDGSLRGGATLFLKKRAVRILPPYFAAMALSLLLLTVLIPQPTGTPWDASLPVTKWDILGNLFLLQNFLPHSGAINHAHWSISLEWWIYFLFPAFVVAIRLGTTWAAALIVLASAVLVYLGITLFGQGFTLQYIGLFAMGMLGAKFAFSGHPRSQTFARRVNWIPATLVLSVAVFLLSKYGVKLLGGHFGPPLVDYVVGLWAMCLLLVIALRQSPGLNHILSFRPLVFIGTFAYSIYLIHAPLIQIVWQYLLEPLELSPLPSYLLLKTIAPPLALLCAYLFYLLCERPFVRAKRHQPAKAQVFPQGTISTAIR